MGGPGGGGTRGGWAGPWDLNAGLGRAGFLLDSGALLGSLFLAFFVFFRGDFCCRILKRFLMDFASKRSSKIVPKSIWE